MTAAPHHRKRDGYTIILVIVFLVVIFVFVMLINSRSVQHLGIVKRQQQGTRAVVAAESGIARALSELKRNRSWDGTTDGSGSTASLKFNGTKMPSSNDSYTVKVYNNLTGASTIQAERGITVPPGACYIMSQGKSGILSAKFVGVMIISSSFFEYGLFADKKAAISGNVRIVAYDSSSGLAVAGGADLATNGINKGSVTLNGSPLWVDGDIQAGHGADLETGDPIIQNGQCTVTGSLGTLPREVSLKEVDLPTSLPERTFSGNTLLPGDYSGQSALHISNQDITLVGAAGGSEYIFDGIQAAGKGKLVVDATAGPVRIYLTGDVHFSGQSGTEITYQNNTVIRPGDLQFLATKDVENIRLTGNSDFYGAIYAPQSDFDLNGTPRVYGGLVASDVFIRGDSQFNYDVTLKDLQDASSLVVGSWQYF